MNVHYRRDGYSIAYEDGEYGYVDASYIDWNSRKRSGASYSPGSGGQSSGGSVTFTDDANVRTGPGLKYGILGMVTSGQMLNYAGSTRYDDRGVAWYSVYYYGRTGWVSSKLSKRGNGR